MHSVTPHVGDRVRNLADLTVAVVFACSVTSAWVTVDLGGHHFEDWLVCELVYLHR